MILRQSPGFNSLDLAALQITLRFIFWRSHEFHFARFCSATESCFSLRLISQRSHGFYFARFCAGATESLCANLRFDWGVFNTYEGQKIGEFSRRWSLWFLISILDGVAVLSFGFPAKLVQNQTMILGVGKMRSISAHDGWKN